jgi:hypothetical protein
MPTAFIIHETLKGNARNKNNKWEQGKYVLIAFTYDTYIYICFSSDRVWSFAGHFVAKNAVNGITGSSKKKILDPIMNLN